jgi:hypothetical protein
VFGTGEEILIDVHFTSEVVVEGKPTMTLTTGCHDDSCYTKEVQSIVCKADFGHFALGFNGNWVTNIDVLADQEVVKNKLEELEGIESVTVSYGLADDRDYSDGRRACTSIGNTITVTIDKHSYRGGHGDLPELQLDILNDPLNKRTFLGVGDGEFLLGRLADSTIGTTPDTGIFTEVVKGLEYEDAVAPYRPDLAMDELLGHQNYTNGTLVVSFLYTVTSGALGASGETGELGYYDSLYPGAGDATVDLAVASIDLATTQRLASRSIDERNFFSAAIRSYHNGQLADLTLPTPGDAFRYSDGHASSLEQNKNIVIDTTAPYVVELTTPVVDGAYGVGHVIDILVHFSEAVTYTGTPRLIVETGDIDDFAPAVNVSNKAITFRYTVTTGDTNAKLDYSDEYSIDEQLGQIYRASTTPKTHATVTLVSPGSQGSLSFLHAIEVDTKNPVVKSVDFKKLPAGTYGVGEVVDIDVTFNYPVTVYGEPGASLGTPFLELTSARTLLFDAIVAIPGDFKAIYAGSNAGVPAAITVSFMVDTSLLTGDKLTLKLPGFSTNMTKQASLFIAGPDAETFNATWHNNRESVVLIAQKPIAYRTVEFEIEARNSINLPTAGILAGDAAGFGLSVDKGFYGSIPAQPINVPSVSFSSASVTFGRDSASSSGGPFDEAAVPGNATVIYLEWTMLGKMAANETITLGIDGFTCGNLTTKPLTLTSCITHQRYYVARDGGSSDELGYSVCKGLEDLDNIGKGDYRRHNMQNGTQQVFTAQWLDALPGGAPGGEKIILTAVTDLEAGTYFAEIAQSNNVALPNTGLKTDILTISSSAESFGPIVDAHPSSLSVAVFDIGISFSPAVAGSPTDFTFEFELGPGDITAEGSMVLKLPGFTFGPYDTQTTNTYEITQIKTSSSLGNVTALWVPSAEELTLIPTTTVPYVIGEKHTVLIPSAMDFKIPSNGIPYDYSPTSSTNFYVTSSIPGVLVTRQQSLAPLPAVGKLSTSTLTYSPATLGAQPGNALVFGLRLEATISRGEGFTVMLPNFNLDIACNSTRRWQPTHLLGDLPEVKGKELATESASHSLNVTCYSTGGGTADGIRIEALETITEGDSITVTVSKQNNIRLPEKGLLDDDASVTVQSDAHRGPTDATAFTADCVGFCSSSLAFTSSIGGQYTGITLKFIFSVAITAGDVFNVSLPHFTYDASTEGKISSAGSFDAYWEGGALALIANGGIDALAEITVSISESKSYIQLPKAGFNKAKTFNISSTAVALFDKYQSVVTTETHMASTSSDVLPGASVMRSSLDYTPQRSGSITDLNFSFKLDVPIYEGETIQVDLDGFSGPVDSNVTFSSPMQRYFSAAYEPAKLTLTARRLVAAGSFIWILVPRSQGIKLPSTSLEKDDPRLKITTTTRAGYVVDKPIETSPRMVGVDDISLNVDFSSYDVGVAVDLDFTLTLPSRINMTVGDTLTMQLPGLVGDLNTDLTLSRNTTTSSGARTTESYRFYDVEWVKTTATMTLTITANQRMQRMNKITFSVLSSNGLKLPTAGIVKNYANWTYMISSTSEMGHFLNELGTRSMTNPCVGICDSSITFTTHKAGYPTGMTLSYETSFAVSAAESIDFLLPMDRMEVINSETGLGSTVDVYGTSEREGLRTLRAQNFSANWYVNRSGAGILQFKVNSGVVVPAGKYRWEVHRDELFKLPKLGIRPNDKTTFKIRSSSSTVNTTWKAIGSVDGVGVMGTTKLSVSPAQVHVPIAVSFEFAANVPLKANDVISVTLHDFTCVDGEIELVDRSSSLFSGVWDSANEKVQLTVKDGGYLPANEKQNVSIAISANMQGPPKGLLGVENDYFIGIQAAEGSIVSTRFDSTPQIGAFLHSSVSFYPTKALEPTSVAIQFELNANITRGDMISLYLPFLKAEKQLLRLNLTTQEPTFVMHRNDSGRMSYEDQRFKGSWHEGTKTLELVARRLINTGDNKASIIVDKSSGLKLPSRGFYGSDSSASYLMSNATSCPVPYQVLDVLQAFGISSSKLTFAPEAVAGGATFIGVTMTMTSPVRKDDEIFVFLPGFTGGPAGGEVVMGGRDGQLLNVTYNSTRNDRRLHVTIKNGTIQSGESLEFVVPMSAGFLLPSRGVLQEDLKDFEIFLKTDAIGNLNVSVQEVQSVGAILKSSLTFSNPVYGEVTGVNMNISTRMALSPGETLDIALPEITGPTGPLTLAPRSSNVVAEFDASSGTLTVTALETMSEFDLAIQASNGLTLPSRVVPKNDPSFTISTSALAGPISTPTPYSSVTPAGKIGFASLEFITPDAEVVGYSGTRNIITFPSGHGLSNDQAGVKYEIGGQLMTVASVAGDDVTMEEAWNGTVIAEDPEALTHDRFYAEFTPTVQVYSPGYREAIYHSGSEPESNSMAGSEVLTFRYVVQPGDFASPLGLNTKRPENVTAIHFSGGSIKRHSLNPETEITRTLTEPMFTSTRITIDASVPKVTEVTTTKADGVYAVGEGIDISITFDAPVTVGSLTPVPNASRVKRPVYSSKLYSNRTLDAPVLFLDISSDGRQVHSWTGDEVRRVAYYASGSNTETLTFVYHVEEGDKSIGTGGYLDYKDPAGGESALVTGSGTETGYIRRMAAVPSQAVDLTLPSTGSMFSLSMTAKVVVDSDAPRVISVSSVNASGTYSAGDFLILLVEYSAPVRVNYTKWSPPVIAMNTGGFAVYRKRQIDNRTLEFHYEVRDEDDVALFDVQCTCKDYLGTTHIIVNSTSIVAEGSVQRKVSTVLPGPGTAGSLGVNRNIKLDQAIPVVTKIYSSSWDGVYTVGDEIDIVVEFSHPVVVDDDDYGSLVLDTGKLLPYILLNAMEGGAAARYVAGSGTTKLHFRYIVEGDDSTSRLDYMPGLALNRGNAPGFDVRILKQSSKPSIDADLRLPLPGALNSLGFISNIVIDTTQSSIEKVDVLPGGISRPKSAGQYIDVDFNCNITAGSFRVNYMEEHTACIHWNASYTEQRADIIAQAMNEIRGLEVEVAAIVSRGRFGELVHLRYNIDFVQPSPGAGPVSLDTCVAPQCSNVTDAKLTEVPLSFVVNSNRPNLPPSGISDIVVQFTHPVHIEGEPVLTVNDTGIDRNVSVVASQRVQVIEIDSPSGPVTMNSIEAGQFQLEYAGLRTGCIDWDKVDTKADFLHNLAIGSFSTHQRDANNIDGTVGRASMRARLEEIPAISAIGIESVTRMEYRNGAKFVIEFSGGEPELLRPVSYVHGRSNPCLPFSRADTSVTIGNLPNATFRYHIPSAPSLVLTANRSIAKDEILEVVVPKVTLPEYGLTENTDDLVIDVSSNGAEYVATSVVKSPAVAAVRRSSISFSSAQCGSTTGISLQFSFSEALEASDTITIELPYFGAGQPRSRKDLILNGTDRGSLDGTWVDRNLTFVLEKAFAANDVIDITVSEGNNITLPDRAIDEVLCGDLKFSVNTKRLGPIIEGKSFERCMTVGFKRTFIGFDPPSPDVNTRLYLELHPSTPLVVNDSLRVYLPGFYVDSRDMVCPKGEVCSVEYTELELSTFGQDADYFTAFWMPAIKTLRLECLRDMLERPISVQVYGTPVEDTRLFKLIDGPYLSKVGLARGLSLPRHGWLPDDLALERGEDKVVTVEVKSVEGRSIAATPVGFSPPVGGFYESTITFRPTPQYEFVTVNITFSLTADLKHGESVWVQFPGFSVCSNTSLVLHGKHASLFTGSWSGDTLKLRPWNTLPRNTTTYIELGIDSRLRLPPDGVLRYTKSHQLHDLPKLSQVKIGTDAADGPVLPLIAATNVGGVGIFYDSHVSFSSNRIGENINITLNFTFNHRVSANDVISLQLPNFIAPYNSPSSGYRRWDNTTIGGPQGELFDATWNNHTSSMEFRRNSRSDERWVHPGPTVGAPIVLVILDSNGMQLPSNGLSHTLQVGPPYTHRGAIEITHDSFNDTIYTNSVPVKRLDTVGVARSALNLSHPNAGEQTEIDFECALSEVLAQGDSVSLRLTGFFKAWKKMDESPVRTEGRDSSWLTGTWYNRTQILKLEVSSRPPEYTQELKVTIPFDEGILVPELGTANRVGDFLVSLEHHKLGTVAGTPIQMLQRIAAIGNSSVTYRNPRAGEQTGILFEFRLTCRLVEGEPLQIKLAHFTKPSFSGVGYEALILHGEHGDNFYAEWWNETQTVRLVPTTTFAANQDIQFEIAHASGIFLPVTGVGPISERIMLSGDLSEGTFHPTRLVSQQIGAFLDASIIMSSARASGITGLSLNFKTHANHTRGDQLTLEMPGFHIHDTTGNLDLGGDVAVSGRRISNTTLVIDILEDLPTYQNLFISILVSNNIRLPHTAVFQNQDTFFLSTNSTNAPVLATSIAHDSSGFVNASLSYSPAIGGEIAEVTLQFTPTLLIKAGSTVSFKLPEFVRQSGKLRLKPNGFDSYFYNTTWSAPTSTLRLKLLLDIEAETSVAPVISYDSGLRLPLDGLRENDPTLRIMSDSIEIGPVRWTPIPVSPALAIFANTEVRFSMPSGPQVSSGDACNIHVNFNLSVPLFPYDAVTLRLPSFTGATNKNVEMGGESGGNFTAFWDPHAAELTFVNHATRLKALSDLRILVLSSAGIKISPYGNRLNDKTLLLSTNASSGAIAAIPVHKSNAVGAILSSSLEYYPPRVGVRTSVTVRFSLASSLNLGDVVRLSLPGFSMNKTSADKYGNRDGKRGINHLSLSGEHATVFNASWVGSLMNGTVELRPLVTLGGETKIVLELSADKNDIFLAKTGLFPNDPALTISCNASTGDVPVESIHESPGVGLRDTSLTFQPAVPGAPTRIALGVYLHCDLVSYDRITLKLPGFTGMSRENVILGGDEASRAFSSQFSGRWDEPSSTLTLRVLNTTVRAGQRYVYIERKNNISLPVSGLTEREPPRIDMKANCSGTTTDIEVLSWTNVGAVHLAELSYKTRTAGLETDVSVQLNVSHDIKRGDTIEVQFPGFEAPNRASVRLRGRSSGLFKGAWSQGDYALPLNLTSGRVLLPSGSGVLRSTTSPTQVLNLTLPLTIIDDTMIDRYAEPMVTNVFVELHDALNKDFFGLGDSIEVKVRFSDAVIVAGKPLLRLDVGAAAAQPYVDAFYAHGSGSDTLAFHFVVASGHTTADLSCYHARALKPNGGSIMLLHDESNTFANLTIPGPLNMLGMADGKTLPVKIFSAKVPSVLSVSTGVNGTYGVGEVIYVTVQFDLPVAVVGVPRLTLRSAGVPDWKGQSQNTAMNVSAPFVRASKTHVFDIGVHATSQVTDGEFVLVHEGVQTGCINWDSASGAGDAFRAPSTGAGFLGRIPNSLEERLFELPALRAVGIVSVQKTVRGNGNRFVVEFAEVVSEISGGYSPSCERFKPVSIEDGLTAGPNMVHIPDRDFMTFRYDVAKGEGATPLEYIGQKALDMRGGTGHGIPQVLLSTTYPSAPANVLLPVPGESGSLSATSGVRIDTNSPSVRRVWSPSAVYGVNYHLNRPPIFRGKTVFGANDEILIRLDYSSPVVVIGSPYLVMNVGFWKKNATFAGGSGTEYLDFSYVVDENDKSNDLGYDGINALHLNGSSIRRLSTIPSQDAEILLPKPGHNGSLSLETNITINQEQARPSVVEVYSSTKDGLYGVGEVVEIFVRFARDVVVRSPGSLRFALDIPNGGNCSYVDGSGTDTLRFTYQMKHGDEVSGLNFRGRFPFDLSNSSILAARQPHVPVNDECFPTASDRRALNFSSKIAVTGDTPHVLEVTSSTVDGVYGVGHEIDFTVKYSLPVVVLPGVEECVVLAGAGPGGTTGLKCYPLPNNGLPGIELDVKRRKDAIAYYASGNGTAVLHFTYVVQDEDRSRGLPAATSTFLKYRGVTALMDQMNGAEIRRLATIPTTPANIRLPVLSTSPFGSGPYLGDQVFDERQHVIRLDPTAPRVESVTTDKPAGDYGAGEVFTIDVKFTREVVSSGGFPSLLMESGDEDVEATYLSGNNSDTLTFEYTIPPDSTAACLDYVDTRTAPYFVHSKGAHGTLGSMAFLVSDHVINAKALHHMPGALMISVKQASTNPTTDALLGLPEPGKDGSITASGCRKIDTTPPEITKVYSTMKDGTFGVGEVIEISLDFTAPVAVTGTPLLKLETGGSMDRTDGVWTQAKAKTRERDAAYCGGSGTSTLVFCYTVEFGDNTELLDYTATDALRLVDYRHKSINDHTAKPATIRRESTNPVTDASLTLPSLEKPRTIISRTSVVYSGSKLRLSTTGFTVSQVSSPMPSISMIGPGQEVVISVTFTEPVILANIQKPPYLLLDIPDYERIAHFKSGSGTTELLFSYIVQRGDAVERLELKGARALVLIHPEDLTNLAGDKFPATALPSPGSANSLSSTHTISISYEPVYAVDVSTDAPPGAYRCGAVIPLHVRYSRPVSTELGTLRMFMNVDNNASSCTQRYGLCGHDFGLHHESSSYDADVLTYQYVVGEGNYVESLDIRDRIAIVPFATDLLRAASYPEMPIEWDLPCPGAAGSLVGNGANIRIVADPPKVTYVDATTRDGTYGATDVIDIVVHWSDSVKVSGVPYMKLYLQEQVRYAVFTGPIIGAALHFELVLENGDATSDLNYDGTDAIGLPKDSAIQYWSEYTGEYAMDVDLTLPELGSASSLGSTKSFIVDNNAPRLMGVSSCTATGVYGAGEEITMLLTFDDEVHLVHDSVSLVLEEEDEGANMTRFSNTTYRGTDGSEEAWSSCMEVGRAYDNNGAFIATPATTCTKVKYEHGVSLVSEVACSALMPHVRLNLRGAKARYVAGSGTTTLTFVYFVPLDTEISALDVADVEALELFDWRVASASGVTANVVLPTNPAVGLQKHSTISIEKGIPVVQSVVCDQPYSSYGYSVGDILGITVTFSQPAAIVESTTLLLSTGRGVVNWDGFAGDYTTATASAYRSGNGTRSLTFEYTVKHGDMAHRLEYINASALVGDVRRSSSHPLRPANMTLAFPGEVGSLSHSANIIIDTSTPVVTGMFALKQGGLYVANEEIAILVRFSQPVIAYGNPFLDLNCGRATLNNSFPQTVENFDLFFDFLPTDLVFVLKVPHSVTVSSIKHLDSQALNTRNGSDPILRHTASPILPVSTRMHAPDDMTDEADRARGRMWTGGRPKKVEVIVRDLFHENAGDLELILNHQNVSAVLAMRSQPGENGDRSFGTPTLFKDSMAGLTRGSAADDARKRQGLGADYIFSDLVDTNLALAGVTYQSSTGYGGASYRAADGITNGYFSRGSVTHTDKKLRVDTGAYEPSTQEPWWLVKLEEDSTIGTIVLWDRVLQTKSYEIQTVTVSAVLEPKGRFTLTLDLGGPGNATVRTDPISVHAVATIAEERRGSKKDGEGVGESMQAKLQGLTDIGVVGVSRRPIDQTISSLGARPAVRDRFTDLPYDLPGGLDTGLAFSGGAGTQRIGYVWSVTFLSYSGDVPAMGSHVNVSYANIDSRMSVNDDDLTVIIDTIQDGFEGESATIQSDPKQTRSDRYGTTFPCHVMVLPEESQAHTVQSISEAQVKSVWATYIESTDRVVTLTLPPDVKGRYVRIQRADGNFLSIAEVQIYSTRSVTTSTFDGGAEVEAQPIVRPFQAFQDMSELFQSTTMDGLWSLTVRDTAKSNYTDVNGDLKEWHGLGRLSDWVLLITDQSNLLHAYYMDITATVTTHPKYGDLYVEQPSPSVRTWSQFYGSIGDPLETEYTHNGLYGSYSPTAVRENWGNWRETGPSYGVDTTGLEGVEKTQLYRDHHRNFNVAPVWGRFRQDGNDARRNYLRDERIVYYIPKQGFQGLDHFSFVINYGVSTSDARGEVYVRVLNCRPYYRDIAKESYTSPHALCDCQTTDEEMFGDPLTCEPAVYQACTESPSLFIPMCVACASDDSGQVEFSAECRTQINRATSLLTERGMCDALEAPVCDVESYYPNSPEAWIIRSTPKRPSELNRLSTLMADVRRVSGP